MMPLPKSMPGRRLIIVLGMWALRILAAAQPGVQPSGSQAAAPCLLTPELIEGPFYLDDKLFRSDITEGQPRNPLNLSISVVDSATCTPLPNALVDIWHCNAVGVYSGFEGNGAPGVSPPPITVRSPGLRGLKAVPTNNSTFLRGILRTDADGVAVFQTIQPGWYAGRAPHIHVKIHVPDAVSTVELQQLSSSHTVHTGQVFFSDALIDQIAPVRPYADDTAVRTPLAADAFFNDPTEILTVRQVDPGFIQAGLLAGIRTIVNREASYTPASTESDVGGPTTHDASP